MAEIALFNPRARKAKSKKTRSRTRARRRNPTTALKKRVTRKVRAMNPRHRARRRNPIGGLSTGGIVALLKGAAIKGVGAVAIDAAMGQVRPMLPASLNTGYGYVATKAVLTCLAGILGKKVLGNVAMQAAEGALTVQSYNLVRSFMPATMNMGFIRAPGMNRGMGLFQRGNMLPRKPNVQIPSPNVLAGMQMPVGRKSRGVSFSR